MSNPPIITARSRNAPASSNGAASAPRQQQQSSATVITRDADAGAYQNVIKALNTYATNAETDPFAPFYSGDSAAGGIRLIQPHFSPYELTRLPVANSTLDTCIAAMVTNCDGFGYTLEYIGKPELKDSAAVLKERQWIDDLLSSPNPDESLVDIRKKVRRDYETLGYAFKECGRDGNGDVGWMYHVAAHSMRMTYPDATPTAVVIKVRRGDVWQEFKIFKRFRRYVQIIGAKQIFFKEFGDPRVISKDTGEVLLSQEPDLQATEIIMLSRYVTGEAYGLPRWINQLPSILGSRECELHNLNFFKDNAIPALAVLVAGGMLTRESVETLRRAFSNRGLDALNRVLILEAQASTDMVGVDGAVAIPRIEMKPLANERQTDATFQEYDKGAQIKVRSAFRLPPIFLGLSDDYTRATAESSMDTAESQVFAPERADTDKIINNLVLARAGIPPTFWRFRSNPAKMVGGETILKSMETMDKVGAMTPNIAIRMTNEMFGTEIKAIEETWGDLPMALVKVAFARGQVQLPGLPNYTPPVPAAPGSAPAATPPGKTNAEAAGAVKKTNEVNVIARTRTRLAA